MILKNQIITNIKIESVNDLYKLKPFLEDGTLKINKSQIARELEVDRRTVDKYIKRINSIHSFFRKNCRCKYFCFIAVVFKIQGIQSLLSKTQDILFSFLDDAFETFGGVPDEIVTDNMKTVMDETRTEYSAG